MTNVSRLVVKDKCWMHGKFVDCLWILEARDAWWYVAEIVAEHLKMEQKGSSGQTQPFPIPQEFNRFVVLKISVRFQNFQ